jgi:integrase
VTGLHVVRKPTKGADRWYVYAWRGGPCVHTCTGERPVIDMALIAKANAAKQDRGSLHFDTFEEIITAYRAAPEYENLKASTKRDYRLWLDRISSKFGAIPLEAFEDRRMRRDVYEWRDQWAHQPRTADKATVMLGTLLGYGVEIGLLSINVAAGIKHLHSVDKSDHIWERRHLRAMIRAPKHLRHALWMAGLTGLRLGDLVRLDWSHVGAKAIIIEKTRKRGGRAVIPLLPETRAALARMGERKGFVLKNSRGKGWTESGLGSVFQKAKPEGFDRTMHDLRGTFATRLIMAGLTDEQAAMVMGWTAKRIASIRARYVNEERVIISLTERLTA